MDYRPLGLSGLSVSAMGLGCMAFGAQADEANAFRQLDMAFDAGITLFDTAENYPSPISPVTQGRSEEILGRWIAARGHRGRVVIASKVAGPGNGAGPMDHIRGPQRRLDAANINAAVEASLRRLGCECIDLYQLHWPERAVTTLRRQRFSALPDAPEQVPIGETLAALGEQQRLGRIRAIGVCNETPWGVMRYLAEAAAQGLPRLAAIQNGYSLLDRQFEIALAEVALREAVPLIGYSPLAAGLLTGKYDPENPRKIAGSRSSLSPGFEARFAPRLLGTAARYAALAREAGLEPAAMALAFARSRPFMASVLVAASTPEQLAGNLAAASLDLPRELIKAIDAIHDSQPNPG